MKQERKSKKPDQMNLLSGAKGIPTTDTDLRKILPSLKGTGHDPESFKLSRRYLMQSPTVERNLFSMLTDEEGENFPTTTEGAVISGLFDKVSELDITCLTYALGKILYDQSATQGNIETNTGLMDAEESRKRDNRGYIATTLKYLCQVAYGEQEPTSAQKSKMKSTLQAAHTFPVEILFPNGDRIKSRICVILDEGKKAKSGAVYYRLMINPVFCGTLIKSDYALFPRDASFRLTQALRNRKERPTPQHYWLMEFLSAQRQDTPTQIGLDLLLDRLKLSDYYRKDKKKAEKRLSSLFDTMKEIGLLRKDLEKNPEIDYRKGDGMTMYIFHINPDWSRLKSSNLLPSG